MQERKVRRGKAIEKRSFIERALFLSFCFCFFFYLFLFSFTFLHLFVLVFFLAFFRFSFFVFSINIYLLRTFFFLHFAYLWCSIRTTISLFFLPSILVLSFLIKYLICFVFLVKTLKLQTKYRPIDLDLKLYSLVPFLIMNVCID